MEMYQLMPLRSPQVLGRSILRAFPAALLRYMGCFFICNENVEYDHMTLSGWAQKCI